MFDKGYNSEKALKEIAKKTGIVSLALLIIDCIVSVILFVVFLDDMWISFVVLGAGLATFGSACLIAHLIYGFGELVGNSKRIASGSSKEKVDIKELEKKITDLPKM